MNGAAKILWEHATYSIGHISGLPFIGNHYIMNTHHSFYRRPPDTEKVEEKWNWELTRRLLLFLELILVLLLILALWERRRSGMTSQQ